MRHWDNQRQYGLVTGVVGLVLAVVVAVFTDSLSLHLLAGMILGHGLYTYISAGRK